MSDRLHRSREGRDRHHDAARSAKANRTRQAATRKRAGMTRSVRDLRAGTSVGVALITAGLAGTIIDNDGKVGLTLFVAGAAGLAFLIGRRLAPALPHGGHRLRLPPKGPIPKVVGWRTIAVAVAAMGILLSSANVFKATDEDAVSRALNYGAWYGFLLLALSLVGVSMVVVGRWLGTPIRERS